MTAPVTQQRTETIAATAPATQARGPGGGWAVRFNMPVRYRLDQLPAPVGDVRLVEVPARRVAAIRFSGRATDDQIVAKESELRAWLVERRLTAASTPVYAYYNDPLTPGFLRRNEVLIDLTPEHEPAPDPGATP